MRALICMLVLGAGLTAASTVPAAANNMGRRSHDAAFDGNVHARFLHHRFFRHHAMLGPFAFGGPFVFSGGYSDDRFAPGMLPVIMPGAAPEEAPLPRRAAVDERASVETTAEGIVIVRGPGSRHLGP